MQVTIKVENPLWEKIQENYAECVDWLAAAYHNVDVTRLRHELCRKYTWSIPDPQTLDFVCKWMGNRAVEMGAGTGYWSWQLSQLGIDMLAFDEKPPDKIPGNIWHGVRDGEYGIDETNLRPIFHSIQTGGPVSLADYADRVLFLCWPPYATPMASDCLEQYQGDRLIFIGEDWGGCTGDRSFFERLEEEWHLVAQHHPVQWDTIHDYVCVYDRRPPANDDVEMSASCYPELLPEKRPWMDWSVTLDHFLESMFKEAHATCYNGWLKRVSPSLYWKVQPRKAVRIAAHKKRIKGRWRGRVR